MGEGSMMNNQNQIEACEFYKMLSHIRRYPELWFGRKNVTALYYYIDGFLMSRPKEANQYMKFEEFFKKKLKRCDMGMSITDLMIANGYSDETGWDYYYKVLDEYAEEQRKWNEFYYENIDTGKAVLAIQFRYESFKEIVREYIAENQEKIFDIPEGAESRIYYKYNDKEQILTCILGKESEKNADRIIDEMKCQKDDKSSCFDKKKRYMIIEI